MGYFFLTISLTFLLFSCSSNELPPSVVAKINNRYISLDELKAMHEVQTVSWELPVPPTFEETRLEYADVLMEMIVTLLLEEELIKNNIIISDTDVQKELDLLQNDYTPEEFERMLVENYIELKGWKAQLRSRLIWDSFLKNILHPQVSVDPREIEAFYEENKESFRKSSSVRIYILASAKKESLIRAQKAVKESISVADIRKMYPHVIIDEVFTLEENLPQKLSSTLKKGNFTEIRKDGNDFVCLYLLERFPAGVPPLKSIELVVEQRLIEEKLDSLYEETINFLLKKTIIEVAPSLKPYISIQEVAKKSSSKNIE
ncbi:MAG: peptidyl-prolyl cis-trans isomerase [Desulfovibrionaceae bacterium]